MTVPYWALTLSYWFHMLATVIWIGGLAAFNLMIVPSVKRLDAYQDQADLLNKVQRRLNPLAWFSLILLLGTGLLQMSANPNYNGFLSISNRWALAILLKHLVFLGMTGVSAYLTWGAMPELERALLRQLKGKEVPEIRRLLKRNLNLVRINLVLGIVTLAFTAFARAFIS